MIGFIEVERISNEEFQKLNTVIIETDENTKYILAPDFVSYPWSKLQIKDIGVEIIRCRVGNKIVFQMFCDKGSLGLHKSEKIVKKILVKE